MKSFFFALLSIWSWFFVFLLTIFFNVSSILLYPLFYLFDQGTAALVHGGAVNWARSIMLTSPFWRLRVEGQENLEPDTHYVIVGNHQSMLDILVSLAALPLHFKFMAKQELFGIPFLGWHMSLAGYIPILRSSVVSGRDALSVAGQWIDRRVSVLFFPEGTRSLDGEIKKFKAGAFKVAKEKKIKILPVLIDGTGDALPKHSWFVNKITYMSVSIQKPIELQPEADLETEIERIRQWMIQRLSVLRKASK